MLDDIAKRELAKPLDRATVKSRKQGGRDVSYIEGWHAIAEANRIFGFDGWTRETIDIRCVAEKPRDIGQAKNAGWGVTYTCKVRVVAGGMAREGCGSGHGIDRDLGQAHESALKEAETDAMKRAFMTFGNPFGLALYDKTQENVVERLTKKEARPMYLAMLREIDELATVRDLTGWRTENTDRLPPFPDDWQANIKLVIEAKIDAVRSAIEVPKAAEILSDGWADKQAANLGNATRAHEPPVDEPQVLWTDDTPPEWDSKWDAQGPVKQAAILCKDPGFWPFLSSLTAPNAVHDENSAAMFVRVNCNIKSRAELATNISAQKIWRDLVADYRLWQREPAIVEVPPHPTHKDQGGAVDQPEPARTTPAGSGAVPDDMLEQIDNALWDAACKGAHALEVEWTAIHPNYQAKLQKRMDEVHRPRAMR